MTRQAADGAQEGVAAGSREQATGLEQVAKAVGEMDKVTQQKVEDKVAYVERVEDVIISAGVFRPK